MGEPFKVKVGDILDSETLINSLPRYNKAVVTPENGKLRVNGVFGEGEEENVKFQLSLIGAMKANSRATFVKSSA